LEVVWARVHHGGEGTGPKEIQRTRLWAISNANIAFTSSLISERTDCCFPSASVVLTQIHSSDDVALAEVDAKPTLT
jgi:negative regulator of replication initiation